MGRGVMIHPDAEATAYRHLSNYHTTGCTCIDGVLFAVSLDNKQEVEQARAFARRILSLTDN